MPVPEAIFSSYFNKVNCLLKAAGLWGDDGKKSHLLKCYNAFWQIYVFVLYLPSESLYIVYSLNDVNKFLTAIRDNGNHIMALYKSANFLLQRKKMLRLMNKLSKEEYHYEDYGDYMRKELVEKESKGVLIWVNSLLYLAMGNCIGMLLSMLYIFIFMESFQYADHNGKKIYSQKLPVESVLFFHTDTRLKYLAALFYTLAPVTSIALMIITLDGLFITFMSCVSAHLKILHGAFTTIHPRCLKKLGMQTSNNVRNPQELDKEIQREISKCISHLQMIFDVSEELEDLFNFQTMFQTFLALGEICFSLYLLSETRSDSIAADITYLAGASYELLSYCWFGNRITQASIDLSFAIYDSDWLSMSTSSKKKLLITMARLSKPIYITIGKITPLTFNTFLTIVRGAYSFFTFLKQRTNLNK